jgi:hypothetical protein
MGDFIMNITMEIKDEEFIKAINGAVEDISQEVKMSLVTEALRTYLSNPDVMRNVLFVEKKDNYSYRTYYEPNEILQTMMEVGPIKDHIYEIQNIMLKYVQDNMYDILIKAYSDAISKTLVPYDFIPSLQTAMNQAVYEHEERKHR